MTKNRAFMLNEIRYAKTWENRAYPLFLRALNDQIKAAVTAVRSSISMTIAESEAIATVRPEVIASAFVKVYRAAGNAYAARELRRMNAKKEEQIAIIGADVLQEPTPTWDDAIDDFVYQSAGDAITGITATSKAHVRQVIANAIAEGKSVYDTAKMMEETLPGINRWRATTIARTEITSVGNWAADMGARASGKQFDKMWLSTFDVRTRGNNPRDKFNHIVMDGTKVHMDEYFNVQGNLVRHPGDKEFGEAENVINCRCRVRRFPL